MSRDKRFLLLIFLNNDIYQSRCHFYCFNNAFVSSVRYGNIGCAIFSSGIQKSNGLYLEPSKSSHDPVVVMKFEFCYYSARLLWKLDHVLNWILSSEHPYWTVQYLCRVKIISMTSNVLPLHFAPTQASSSQNSNVENF